MEQLMTIRSIGLAAALALVAAPSCHSATMVAYEFTGILTTVWGTTAVSLGDSFSGQLRYDPNVDDEFPHNREFGAYPFPSAPLGMSSLTTTFESGPTFTLSRNSVLEASVQLYRPTGVLVAFGFFDSTSTISEFPTSDYLHGIINLRSNEGVLESDALVTDINLSEFSERVFQIVGYRSAREPVFLVYGEFTSLTRIVPEPSVVTLALASLVSLPVVYRRRR
jgi:hypothetical protein